MPRSLVAGKSDKLALASLALAAAGSLTLAFAPTGTSVEAVEVQLAGGDAPRPAHVQVSHPSLFSVQGKSVLVPLAIPVLIAAVGVASRRRARPAATIVLLLFSIIGAASIGLFYLPAAAFMAFASGTRSDA